MEDMINSNLVYNNKDGIEYIQFKRLLEYPEIKHCYTLRSGNQIDFSSREENKRLLDESYKRICHCLNLDSATIMRPHQKHTDNVVVVEHIKNLSEVDGMITNKPNITLLTTSADCTSLLFYDPVKKIIGAVHSGWRGTLQAIGKKAVEKMIQEYNSNSADIICCICPCIRQCCFEVEEEVRDLFYEKYHTLEQINSIIQEGQIKEGKQKYYIDTTEINKKLLEKTGLKSENIIDSGLCTKCHPELFHSYRVEKEQVGLNAGMICLSPN